METIDYFSKKYKYTGINDSSTVYDEVNKYLNSMKKFHNDGIGERVMDQVKANNRKEQKIGGFDSNMEHHNVINIMRLLQDDDIEEIEVANTNKKKKKKKKPIRSLGKKVSKHVMWMAYMETIDDFAKKYKYTGINDSSTVYDKVNKYLNSMKKFHNDGIGERVMNQVKANNRKEQKIGGFDSDMEHHNVINIMRLLQDKDMEEIEVANMVGLQTVGVEDEFVKKFCMTILKLQEMVNDYDHNKKKKKKKLIRSLSKKESKHVTWSKSNKDCGTNRKGTFISPYSFSCHSSSASFFGDRRYNSTEARENILAEDDDSSTFQENKRGKLNPHYIGPFRIIERIGPVAYHLELPQELSRVHNVFQVCNLKKCLSDEELIIPLEEIQLNDKLNFVEEPVEIKVREVKKLKQSRIPIVKVRWSARRGPEFTWEREDQFKNKYPHLFSNEQPTATSLFRDKNISNLGRL
nr:putative reverse transcriptase domain-containing protein [Tanacetum cinerariifolium]